jgi:hypothetical protein
MTPAAKGAADGRPNANANTAAPPSGRHHLCQLVRKGVVLAKLAPHAQLRRDAAHAVETVRRYRAHVSSTWETHQSPCAVVVYSQTTMSRRTYS